MCHSSATGWGDWVDRERSQFRRVMKKKNFQFDVKKNIDPLIVGGKAPDERLK